MRAQRKRGTGRGRPGHAFTHIYLQLVAGKLRQPANFSARKSTSARTRAGTNNAANLLRAHALAESGRAMGKVVLQGF
jgi:hypothetical protein